VHNIIQPGHFIVGEAELHRTGAFLGLANFGSARYGNDGLPAGLKTIWQPGWARKYPSGYGLNITAG
jgi:hypothetical protein